MTNQLQEECSRLTNRVNELVRENVALRAQVDFFERRVAELSAQSNAVSSPPPPLGLSHLLAQQLLNRASLAHPLLQQPSQLQTLVGQRDGSGSSIPSARGNVARSFHTPGLQQQQGGVLNRQQTLYPLSASTAQLSPRSRALVFAMLEEQEQKSRNLR